MPKLISLGMLLTFIGIINGCAGSSTVGSFTQYFSDLGITTNIGFREEAERILIRKHQYIVQVFEESLDRSYLETDWKDRLPFEDEAKTGVVQAKSRIILEGRSRVRGTATATLKVKFRGENMLLYENSPTWEIAGPMSQLSKEYFKAMANEIKTEYSTRTREY